MLKQRPIDILLGGLTGVYGKGPRYRAICPAHESKHGSKSLSILEKPDGTVVVTCWAGCSVQQIMESLNLSMSDLFVKRLGHFIPGNPMKRIEREKLEHAKVIVMLGTEDLKRGATFSVEDQMLFDESKKIVGDNYVPKDIEEYCQSHHREDEAVYELAGASKLTSKIREQQKEIERLKKQLKE